MGGQFTPCTLTKLKFLLSGSFSPKNQKGPPLAGSRSEVVSMLQTSLSSICLRGLISHPKPSLFLLGTHRRQAFSKPPWDSPVLPCTPSYQAPSCLRTTWSNLNNRVLSFHIRKSSPGASPPLALIKGRKEDSRGTVLPTILILRFPRSETALRTVSP